MNEKDKQTIIERYSIRLEQLGPTPAALGEPKRRQNFFFHFLLGVDGFLKTDSVLDVGCGFGDLIPFLEHSGWNGDYTGIDIVPDLISIAEKKYAEHDFLVADIESQSLNRKWDWVISSYGLMVSLENVDNYQHFESMVSAMWRNCSKGLTFNLFSPLVEFENPIHFHPAFGRVIEIVSKMTKRFTIRHDYRPYEFAVYMYKDDRINKEESIFECHSKLLNELRGNR